MENKLQTCLKSIREKTDFKPEVALILGSGLGDYAEGIKIEASVEYSQIEGFPVSTVQGHKGRFVFGYVEEVPVVIMQGSRIYSGSLIRGCWVLPISPENTIFFSCPSSVSHISMLEEPRRCPASMNRTLIPSAI